MGGMHIATSAPATGVATEIVLLTADQQEELEAIVRRLHHTLGERFHGWLLTIADQGSSDGTLGVARRLSSQLANVRVVELEERMDRRSLRQRWAAGTGSKVAFVELAAGSDVDQLLAPLERTGAVAGGSCRSSLLTRRSALLTLGGAGLGV